MRKIISLLIIYLTTILVLGPCLSAINISNNENIILKKLNIIHVYPGDSIQDAIDMANSRETVFVHSGIYYEKVDICKSITLAGENKVTTVIDGNKLGDVVTTKCNDVIILGFTIQNSGPSGFDHAITCSENRNAQISNCIIKDNAGGIRFNSVSDSTINNCEIYQNLQTSITIYEKSNNIQIKNCIIKNNGDIYIGGIHISSATNIDIKGCQIDNNHCGISLVNAKYVNIYDNTLDGNSWGNIELLGTEAQNPSHVRIYNNKIINSPDNGILIQSCPGNIIVENNIINSNEGSGILILRSPNNIVTGNSLSNNKVGIQIKECSYNTEALKDENTFYNNGKDISTKKINKVLSRFSENLKLPNILLELLEKIGIFNF